MKLAAIICEFNPLHTGHKKLIDFAKTVADKVVCIMSGNFVQRGMPACADKYSRAKHAILAGAHLVVELPTVYATASAENFAYGGVTIADKLGVDYLVFGSECGDIATLMSCVEMLAYDEINNKIKQEVSKGVSYPKAVALATGLDVLESPNNVLAIEYLKAIRNIHSKITPITIKRENNYNSTTPKQYASSSAIRSDMDLGNEYSFDYVMQDVDNNIETKYCQLVPSFLSVASRDQLEQTEGVTEGLHNRIFNADKTQGYGKMFTDIKTKRYTQLKLQRVFFNQIVGITKEIVKQSKKQIPAIKVLAVNANSVNLLEGLANETDEITQRADRLYATISGKIAPTKLVKIDVNF